MQGVEGRVEGRDGEVEMDVQIREIQKENEGLGKIADLLSNLLYSSEEEKEELQRLRKIQDDMRSKDDELEAKLQAKEQQFTEKEANLLDKIAVLQKDINSLKNEEKNKLDAATQQLQSYKRKVDELTKQNISNMQKLEKKINEMSLNQKTAQQSWSSEKISYKDLLSQAAAKHQEAYKAMEIYQLKVEAEQRQTKSKYEKERKFLEAQFQKQKKKLQQQLNQEQISKQRLESTIKQLQATMSAQRKTIQDITAQHSKQSYAYKSILAQMPALQDQCKEKILSETNKLNAEYSAKLNVIRQENQKVTRQIETSFKQSIEKQSQVHLKEVNMLHEQIRTLKETNESNIRSSSYELARLKSSSLSEKQELTDMLSSIYSVVFGRTLEVVQNKQITQFVQKKFNDLTAKVSSLEQGLESSSKQCKALQSQLSQVKKFLNTFSVKLNNPEILNALDKLDTVKASNFVFSQQDLMESVTTITKRLVLRLKECKEEMENLEREKGELLSQQFESDRKTLELQKRIDQLEGRLKKEEEHARELIAEHKVKEDRNMAERLAMEGKIHNLHDSVDKLNKEISSSKKQVEKLSENIRKQDEELLSLSQQNAVLKDHLVFEANKNQRNAKEMSSLQQQYDDLSKENIQLLQSSESLASQIYNLKAAISKKQQQHEAWKRRQIDQINAFIDNHYDSRGQLDSFDAFLDFLKDNQTLEVVPFTVSHILQRAAKERQILTTQASLFLIMNVSSTTLLYKYDQFNKNFSNYLPIRQNFPFVILAKTKKLQIFGVLSTGLGNGSRSLAFNLTEPKFFQSNPNNASSTYDSGHLIFGHSEIRFRNNSTLQAVVNSRIFGARHFTFKKDQLVGQNEDSDSVQLQALQIHRLNY